MKEVLIVDDEPAYRRGVDRALRRRFVVHQAESIPVAISLLEEKTKVQVILLDLEFGDGTGLKGTHLLENLKQRLSPHRVIVLTGHQEHLAAEQARDFHVFSYLAKAKAGYDQSLIFEVERAFWSLERSSLTEKLERHFDIQRTIAEDKPLDETLDLVCKSAREIVGGYTCHIRLLDLKNGDFVLSAARGPFDNVREIFQERTAMNDVFSGRVAQTGVEENHGKLQEDPNFIEMREKRLGRAGSPATVNRYFNEVRSAYIVPISTKIFENKVDAVLNVSSTLEDFFTPERCQVVDEFRTQAEIAITKEWLRHRKKEAQKDYSDSSDLLVQISEQLRRENNLEKIYEIVATGISKIVHPEMISIFRYDERTEMMVSVFECRGDVREDNVKEAFRREESLTGTVFRTGESIRIPSAENPINPTDDLRYDGTHERVNLEKIPSHRIEHYLAVPVKFGNAIIGIIRAVNKKSGYYRKYIDGDESVNCLLERGFSHDCQTALEIIASHLGVAIQNSELFNKLNWKISQLETLTQVARRISSDSEADIDKLLHLIVTKTAEMMHAEICMLFLKEEKSNKVALRKCYGMPMIPGAYYDLGEGKTGQVAKDGQPLLESVADPEHPGKYSDQVIPYLKEDEDGERRIKSFMAVPIIALERSAREAETIDTGDLVSAIVQSDEGTLYKAKATGAAEHEKITGVLKVYNKVHEDRYQFDDDDLKIFQTFASQIGVALALAERSTDLSHLVRGVCHEIRNKAGMIPPNVDMIREDLELAPSPRNKEIAAKLELVETAAYQALDFARDLLGFSDSHFQFREDLDINELIKDAVDQLLSHSKSLKNALEVRFEGRYLERPVICSVFRTPFIHIIQNIVMNAYEAMEEVNSPTFRVTTEVDKSGKVAYITLVDNGKGIPADDIPKLFEATFFRRKGGNGLGLWLVKNYLSRMDGIVSVRSQLNTGTALTIQLPTVEARLSTSDE